MAATKISSCERVLPTPLADLPDGEYAGEWSGYVVDCLINDGHCRFTTEDRVRGVFVPCIITVKGGEASVRAVR